MRKVEWGGRTYSAERYQAHCRLHRCQSCYLSSFLVNAIRLWIGEEVGRGRRSESIVDGGLNDLYTLARPPLHASQYRHHRREKAGRVWECDDRHTYVRQSIRIRLQSCPTLKHLMKQKVKASKADVCTTPPPPFGLPRTSPPPRPPLLELSSFRMRWAEVFGPGRER